VRGKYLVLALAGLLGLLAYFYFAPSEEKKIKEQLALLSRLVSKDGRENAFALARRLEKIGLLFADKVDLKTAGYDFSGRRTRQEIVNLAARARMGFSRMTLKFEDVSVAVSGEAGKVTATGMLRGRSAGGEEVEEIREVKLSLQKGSEGRWLFTALEAIEVLKK
jgi:ketosteroid isomerase-like protein